MSMFKVGDTKYFTSTDLAKMFGRPDSTINSRREFASSQERWGWVSIVDPNDGVEKYAVSETDVKTLWEPYEKNNPRKRAEAKKRKKFKTNS